jgi:hypothetical protein
MKSRMKASSSFSKFRVMNKNLTQSREDTKNSSLRPATLRQTNFPMPSYFDCESQTKTQISRECLINDCRMDYIVDQKQLECLYFQALLEVQIRDGIAVKTNCLLVRDLQRNKNL